MSLTLESRLWESADILRCYIDASDFKIGLLFLRRFNGVFEERVRPLEQDEKLGDGCGGCAPGPETRAC